ncbi:hypothetical protein C4B68_33085 [Streptomyces dengpaensis]|uniref:Uncharacterized protein n=1 Tax=Streptomyces dengpaensis TaxID=2049881 RepID=A0ABM6SYU7_9ACTN|nr:hypothetical protein C4B68_33085 [Streptomyces dengpaensis]
MQHESTELHHGVVPHCPKGVGDPHRVMEWTPCGEKGRQPAVTGRTDPLYLSSMNFFTSD